MSSDVDTLFDEIYRLTEAARNSERLTIADILALWGLNLDELAHIDLSGEDLTDQVLDGANMLAANLSFANMRGASLVGANLKDANMSGCDLNYADMSGASLMNADLRGAQLESAVFAGANLESAKLDGASISKTAFHGATVSRDWADEKMFSYRPTENIGAVEIRTVSTTAVFKHGGILGNVSEIPGPIRARAIAVAQPFNYMFPELARDANAVLSSDDPPSIISQLKELGDAMADNDAPADDSMIAPVYTYLGQFIDHDITVTVFDPAAGLPNITEDFEPVHPDQAIAGISNGRRAIFDLDSLYGDGPTFPGESPESEAQSIGMFDGPKMKMGMITVDGGSNSIPGEFIPPVGDLKRDLPRNTLREPIIGDRRNDGNLIVAQLHTGFLRFHNALVDALDSGQIAPPNLDTPDGEPTKGYYDDSSGGHQGGCSGQVTGDRALFEQASTLARRHYQWMVVHDYLKTIGKPSVVDRILQNGPTQYTPTGSFPYMPFEHSVSAYRFGHSMVRHEYDFNRNFNSSFGTPGGTALFHATFDQLFVFTGKGQFNGPGGPTPTLPFNWVIEWENMVDASRQAARKIDTRLASDLADMTNEVIGPPENGFPIDIQNLLKHLAQRNLLRSYLFSVPTGQAMATAMGFDVLSADEMKSGNDNALNTLLQDSGFLERTPSWYYILKEAEVREDGNSLGELGTAIVAETFIGLLKADNRSIFNEAAGWKPSDGADVSTIAEMLSFAGVLDQQTRSSRKKTTPA